MIDETLYRETFSRLRASDEAKKEVLMNMSETKKTLRRPLRALRAVGMAAMLTLALAVSANAASGGELLEGIYQSFVITFTTPEGSEHVTVNVAGGVPESALEGLVLPEHGSAFTEMRDGRLYLTAGGEETDITSALTEDGEYTARLDDGTTVTVQGTVENHMILSSAEDSSSYYITTSGDPDALKGMDLIDGEDVTVSVDSMTAFCMKAD